MAMVKNWLGHIRAVVQILDSYRKTAVCKLLITSLLTMQVYLNQLRWMNIIFNTILVSSTAFAMFIGAVVLLQSILANTFYACLLFQRNVMAS